jgi:Uma2 family endonuclease
MGAISPNLVSADDLFALPEDGLKHELVRGELRTMTPAGSEHGAIGARLLGRLALPVLDQRLGQLFNADTGFLIARNPDTVRAPDVAFVARERLAEPLPEGFFPGPPDLAVEVVSPSDRLAEVEGKVQDWLQAGCREVWVVSPRSRRITVYRSASDIRVLSANDTLASAELLPGFACRVAEVFGG